MAVEEGEQLSHGGYRPISSCSEVEGRLSTKMVNTLKNICAFGNVVLKSGGLTCPTFKWPEIKKKLEARCMSMFSWKLLPSVLFTCFDD